MKKRHAAGGQQGLWEIKAHYVFFENLIEHRAHRIRYQARRVH